MVWGFSIQDLIKYGGPIMKEIIITISIIVKDDFDDWDLEEAAGQNLEDGWQFSKAQRIVLDRPDVKPDDGVIAFTNHKVVVAPEVKIEFELHNEL
jgi:hypothetical protein